MSGLTDLKQTLQSITIVCNDVAYGFASLGDGSGVSDEELLATFHENGRLAVIASKQYLDGKHIDNEGPYAKLTVDVHTSLELVGLTAVLASKLAGHGISANVVAAFYHDHIFVPYERRTEATQVLESLRNM